MANKKTLAQRVAVLEKLVEILMEEGAYQELNRRLQEVEVQLDLRVAAEEDEDEEEDEDDENEPVKRESSPYPWDDVPEELQGTCYIICMPCPSNVKGLPKYLGYLADAEPPYCWVDGKYDVHAFSTKARAQEAVKQIKQLYVPSYKDGKKTKQMERFIPTGRTVRVNQIEVD